MSDILTRLLLNTGDYDTKLAKAKKSSGDFALEIGGKAAGMVGKFAAGIGVAMGGVEAFQRVLNSTQTSGDLMRGTMQSLKTSVDEFFYSVNKGNLSLFIQNLGDIASKTRDAYGALDQLGNTQISYGVLGAKNSAAIAEAQYLAKNKFAPTSVRESAFADWANAIMSEEGNVKALQRELVNAATAAVEARTNANLEITLEDLVRAFETDLKDPTSRALAKSRAEMGMRNYEANAKRTDWTQEQKDALAELQRENIITYTMLEKYSDEELQSIAKQIQQYYGLINAVKNLGREYNETANEFNNANKNTKGFNPIESLSGYSVYSGSSEAGKNFGASKSNAPKLPVVVGQINYDTPLGKKVLEWMNGKEIPVIKTEIEIEDENIDEEDLSGKWGEHIKKIEDMNSALGSTGEIFNSLGSIMGSFGEDMGAWMFGTVGQIAQMIVQLQSLATARAVAEGAKVPFPGNIAAIATVVATIASVFSSLPKFADGGIVGGSSYFGDKLLARVNSGEMILNQGQQARLLNLTEGSNVRVSGDVRLNGKDIYISLRNYMSASGNRL